MDERSFAARDVELFGRLPEGVAERAELARLAGREAALLAVENLREELIRNNPLGRRQQQLVHLGMLLVVGREAPAQLHAHAAVAAGATAAELHGVCETAAIVGGMPAYSLGVKVVRAALSDAQIEEDRPHD